MKLVFYFADLKNFDLGDIGTVAVWLEKPENVIFGNTDVSILMQSLSGGSTSGNPKANLEIIGISCNEVNVSKIAVYRLNI